MHASDIDWCFLEVGRYILLNPVPAPMVDTPSEYLWSNWYSMMGDNQVPEWLAVDQTLLRFATTRTKALSLEKYKQICSTRNDAIIAAFKSGGYTQKEIGDFVTLHYSMSEPNSGKKQQLTPFTRLRDY